MLLLRVPKKNCRQLLKNNDDDDDDGNDCLNEMKSYCILFSNNNRKLVTKRSTLIRRNAFKRKNRILHPYFDRKQNEQLALYQNHFLNVTLPRRIHLRPLFANKLKLCGGNAVGIFVHTIAEELKNFLQIGDQILEYNKYDLTQATAEDAALHLAEPIAQNIQTAELVVLFNIDGEYLIN